MKLQKLFNTIAGLFGSPGTLTPEEKAFIEAETRKAVLIKHAQRKAETGFDKLKKLLGYLAISIAAIFLLFVAISNLWATKWTAKQFISGVILTFQHRIQDLETPTDITLKKFNDSLNNNKKAWSEVADSFLARRVGNAPHWDRYSLEGQEGLRRGPDMAQLVASFLLSEVNTDDFERLSKETKDHLLRIGRMVLENEDATWREILAFRASSADNKERLDEAFEQNLGSVGTEFGAERIKAYREAHPMTAEAIKAAERSKLYAKCVISGKQNCSNVLK